MKTVLRKGGLLEHFLTTYTSVWRVEEISDECQLFKHIMYGLIAILFLIMIGIGLSITFITGNLGIWLFFEDKIFHYQEFIVPAIIVTVVYGITLLTLCNGSVKKYSYKLEDSVLTQNNFVKIIKMRYSAIKNKYCNIIEWKEKDE